jgi:hypothetical protein
MHKSTLFAVYRIIPLNVWYAVTLIFFQEISVQEKNFTRGTNQILRDKKRAKCLHVQELNSAFMYAFW